MKRVLLSLAAITLFFTGSHHAEAGLKRFGKKLERAVREEVRPELKKAERKVSTEAKRLEGQVRDERDRVASRYVRRDEKLAEEIPLSTVQQAYAAVSSLLTNLSEEPELEAMKRHMQEALDQKFTAPFFEDVAGSRGSSAVLTYKVTVLAEAPWAVIELVEKKDGQLFQTLVTDANGYDLQTSERVNSNAEA